MVTHVLTWDPWETQMSTVKEARAIFRSSPPPSLLCLSQAIPLWRLMASPFGKTPTLHGNASLPSAYRGAAALIYVLGQDPSSWLLLCGLLGHGVPSVTGPRVWGAQ